MDYEKAYKDALERAKYWEKNPTVWSSDDICQKLFPELVESEDERIRKELIDRFKSLKPNFSWYEVPIDNILAWLEKQGEKQDYNPYKATIESIAAMVEKYANGDLKDFYDNIKVKCKDAIEYDNTWNEKQCEQKETSCDRCKKAQPYHSCQDITELGRCYLELEKQSEHNSTNSYCEEHCKGFQETGKCFADGECKAKIDEKHKVGKYFTGLIPCWVDAPSTLQPAHNYHGKNIVAIHLKDGGYRCCCIDDKKPVTFSLPENTSLVEGWRRKSGEWSDDDEKMMQCIHKYVKASASNFDYENIQIWFRNIKNRVQPHWKPTEEQIEAVKCAAKDVFESSSRNEDLRFKNEPYFKSLYSLYEQLEKLKS